MINFNSTKTKKRISTIIIIVLILAMIVPIVLDAFAK